MTDEWFLIAYAAVGAVWAGLNHSSTFVCRECERTEIDGTIGVALSVVRGAAWPVNVPFKIGKWYRAKFLRRGAK